MQSYCRRHSSKTSRPYSLFRVYLFLLIHVVSFRQSFVSTWTCFHSIRNEIGSPLVLLFFFFSNDESIGTLGNDQAENKVISAGWRLDLCKWRIVPENL